MSQTKAQLLAPIGVVTFTGVDVTGDITGNTASFTSNVSIGGTLTYEDVTNIDSVGLITARKGINVTAGVSTFAADINANGNIVGDDSTNISGIASVTATTYYGSGASLTGIDATSLKDSGGSVKVQANQSGAVVTGVLTATSFKGDGSTLSGIDAAPVFSATASGTIANGKTVILNQDATVSAAATTEVAAATGSLQAVPMASNIYTNPQDAVWLSNTKYISFWLQWNNSNGLWAQVGTVSGTTITFGTPTQIRNGVTTMSWASCDYDATNEVVMVAHGVDPVEVIGLTVSGTTITENTNRAVISGYNCPSGCIRSDQKGGFMFIKIRNNGDASYHAGTISSDGVVAMGTAGGGYGGYNTSVYRTLCSLAYSADEDKWVATLLDGTTACRVSIGSRSGTTATMTNPGNLSYASGNGPNAVAYDTANKYFIMFFRKSGGGGISMKTFELSSGGSTITIGQTVNSFDDQDIDDYMEARYSPASGKVYVFMHETAGTSSMRLLTVTMPDTSAGTPTKTAESVGTASDIAKCGGLACSNDGKVLTQQRGGGTPYYNYNRIKQEQVITTNLLTYNFIGFSADNYTDGQTVKIKTVGNTDGNQTGLITATRYYVQRGGELSDSAGDPSVYAGLALNSTTIAVKFPI